jgi:hypothetical protein
MQKHKLVRVVGFSIIGALLIGLAIPVNCSANPAHWWRQITTADFNSDTMTDVHLYSQVASCAFVHLVDDETETDSFDYNPATAEQIWEQGGGNNPKNVGAFSQSFTPDIDGVVDTVDMRVWRVGNPLDASLNPATLTIEITDAVQSGIYQPILNTIEVQCTYSSGAVSNQQQLNSYRLTDTDSDYSNPPTSGHIYTLYVTSTATPDANWQDYFGWECTKNPPQDTTGTYGCQKTFLLDGIIQWVPTGGGQGTYDFPFIVYVHNFVHSGNILSVVYDCGATSTFTDVVMGYTQGGTVTLYVRTGPNSNPPQSWSNWVNEGTGSQNPGLTQNRYVQYELDFVAGDDDLTTQGVRMVGIGYNTP